MGVGKGGGNAGWAFIIPGSTLLGMGIGLFINNPGFGLFTGLGAGMLVWGTIVAIRGR